MRKPGVSYPVKPTTIKGYIYFLTIILTLAIPGISKAQNSWLDENGSSYKIHFKAKDKANEKEYRNLVDNGIKSVQLFFGNRFKKEFDVYVHPDHHSLDSTWQKDWNMPTFKSECWMVASGIASKLDVISPADWEKESCEHTYADKIKTQQLITHELVHVYHGQLNTSPDFSNTSGIDWFVEGLATYASGQCDRERITEVRKAIATNKITMKLDSFWTGNIKYGLSGSLVMYIDRKYGRDKLRELLKFNNKPEILTSLGTTEESLLADWKIYMTNEKQ